MAEELDKSISELTSSPEINETMLFLISLLQGEGYDSFKVTGADLYDLVTKVIENPLLTTNSKKIVDAIDEVNGKTNIITFSSLEDLGLSTSTPNISLPMITTAMFERGNSELIIRVSLGDRANLLAGGVIPVNTAGILRITCHTRTSAIYTTDNGDMYTNTCSSYFGEWSGWKSYIASPQISKTVTLSEAQYLAGFSTISSNKARFYFTLPALNAMTYKSVNVTNLSSMSIRQNGKSIFSAIDPVTSSDWTVTPNLTKSGLTIMLEYKNATITDFTQNTPTAFSFTIKGTATLY